MEYIVAFIMIFGAIDLGPVKAVDVNQHALAMCRTVYPEGQVDLFKPVAITLESGYSFTTSHVYRCLRPKLPEDYKLEEQPEKETP